MRVKLVFATLPIIILLSGCESPREVLGFNRQTHDEFGVLPRTNLSLPDQFDTLPLPMADTGVKKKNNQTKRAQKVTLGKLKKAKSATLSESELLKLAGADDNQHDIRLSLEKDQRKQKGSSASFVKDLLKIKRHNNHTLDPVAEAERLKND